MRHGLFTLALAAALTACSKPNPLFLDTWEGLSEAGSQASAETTDEPTATTASTSSVDPTSTTTLEETTTANATATTASSEPPTGTTGSTGQACVSQMLMPIEPARDTFVAHAEDVAKACTLDGMNSEVFVGAKCRHMDFGAQTHLSLFRGKDFNEAPRMSAYMLDFPRDATGQLLHGGEVLPVAAIEKVWLRLAYSNKDSFEFETAVVDVYAIPTEFEGSKGEWVEGPGEAVACEAATNFACTLCSAGDPPPPCEATWFGQPEFFVPPDTYKIASAELPIVDKSAGTVLIELDPALFGETPHNGFLVVTQAMVKGMQIVTNTPPGPLRMHAREYEDPQLRPALLIDACL